MSLTLEQLNALTTADIERIAYRLQYDERGYVRAKRRARNARVWQQTKAVKNAL